MVLFLGDELRVGPETARLPRKKFRAYVRKKTVRWRVHVLNSARITRLRGKTVAE